MGHRQDVMREVLGEPAKGKSILATSRDEGRTFQTLVRVPTPRMVNIMPIVVPSADVPGADTSSPQTVLMCGRQRQSAIVLAQAPLTRIADASSWRFASSESDGTGWVTDGAAAAERVPASYECNGNFSITYIAGLGKWLMLNRCDEPHAILLRTSRSFRTRRFRLHRTHGGTRRAAPRRSTSSSRCGTRTRRC